METRTCEQCGKEFKDDRERSWWAPREDRKFCSNKCRQAAYRRRRHGLKPLAIVRAAAAKRVTPKGSKKRNKPRRRKARK